MIIVAQRRFKMARCVAQKFIVLYNEKVRVEIIVELRKGQTEDESGYFIIRYRGI